MRRPLALALTALLAGCAAPRALRPSVADDYLYPLPRAGELGRSGAERFERSWRAVLAGDSEAALRGFREVLRRAPGAPSAETGLGYAQLRAGRFAEAMRCFEGVLLRQADYVPALVGAGAGALHLGDAERALGFFKRAQRLSPNQPLVDRRVAALKLQLTERRVAQARAALQRGDRAAALEEYRLALEAAPEVGALRIEYADLLLVDGEVAAAVETLRDDGAGDRAVALRLGEILSAQQEHGAALEVYRRILQRDPKDAEAQQRALAAREALELQGLPAEYRAIGEAARITRADLAALVAVKVTATQRFERGEPEVAVDIAGSWAREYILQALAYELMAVYPNHSFQPGAIARRGDLARAVARVLELTRQPHGEPPTISDMSPQNIYHSAASRAVAAGLMDLTEAGAFEAWRPVSGREASDVVEALARLVGP